MLDEKGSGRIESNSRMNSPLTKKQDNELTLAAEKERDRVQNISACQPVTVVLPYHVGDAELAGRLMDWINELDGPSVHSCLLVADNQVPLERQKGLKENAKRHFRFVEAMNVAAVGMKGHAAANMLLHFTSEKIMREYKRPFLWLEPDCVPLAPLWLDTIAADYAQSAKRYMGALIDNPKPEPPLPARFLAGCAVYPPDAHEDLRPFLKSPLAWDMAGADKLVPMAQGTRLIQHFHNPNPPIFKEYRSKDDPENIVTKDFIQDGAVLFHSDKSGTLLAMMNAINETRKRLAHQLTYIPSYTQRSRDKYYAKKAAAQQAEEQQAEAVPEETNVGNL